MVVCFLLLSPGGDPTRVNFPPIGESVQATIIMFTVAFEMFLPNELETIKKDNMEDRGL